MKHTNLAIAPEDCHVILGVPVPQLAHELTATLQPSSRRVRFSSYETLAELRSGLVREGAAAVVLDDAIFGGAPFSEALLQITEFSPVIVMADPARQIEFARWIAIGELDYVAKVGDFVSLAAAFIARRVRWAEMAQSAVGLPWRELPPDFASILRHEINNPLTGILGNAELLLSNLRDRLPVGATQRLETVVDLALRLRETTRRLSNAWEREHAHARTA